MSQNSECDSLLNQCDAILNKQEKLIAHKTKIIEAQKEEINILKNRVVDLDSKANTSTGVSIGSVILTILVILL